MFFFLLHSWTLSTVVATQNKKIKKINIEIYFFLKSG